MKKTRAQEAVERCNARVAAAAQRHKKARAHLMAAIADCENAAIDQVLEIERLERAKEKVAAKAELKRREKEQKP